MNATAVLDIVPESHSFAPNSLSQTPMPRSGLASRETESPDQLFPKAGDEFYGYELVEELGRGGFARVYLAREHRLANRCVVLKIATKSSSEPLRLARLQHTNIVPIQTAFRAGPYQVVQMPFLGRQTLAHVIDYVRASTGFPEIGGEVFTTAAQYSTHRESKIRPTPKAPAVPQELPVEQSDVEVLESHPLRDMMTEMSYPKAVLTIMRRLADGLAHAHTRNILHLDLKPHNILFGEDGQPLLLDFNLSRDRTQTERKRVGGTWPYMSPEAIREYGGLSEEKSDERTDLFALGVIFYQLLTCRLPFPSVALNADNYQTAIDARENFVSDLREHNPEVPHAMESIVLKLLAGKPENRYQTVDELREDLQREEESQPLKFAKERNPVERFAKWRRRNPGLLARIMACGVLLTFAAGAFAFQQVQTNRNQLVAKEQSREFQASLATARFDVCDVQNREIRKEGMAVLTKLLGSYRVAENANWHRDERVQNLTEEDRASLFVQLREAALLLAHGELLEARSQNPAERATALSRAKDWNLLAGNIPCTKSSSTLWEQRKQIATELSDPTLAATAPSEIPASNSVDDLYLAAASYFARDELPKAIEKCVELTLKAPDHYAGHALLGLSYHMSAEPRLALERYQIARSLAHVGTSARYNRAHILSHLGRNDLAESELDQLLALAPQDTRSLTLRGLVRQSRGKHTEAIEDFQTAMKHNGPAVTLHYALAKSYKMLKNETEAERHHALAETTTAKLPEEFVVRGNRWIQKDPTAAVGQYNEALKITADYLPALQNKAIVLADNLGEWDLALKVLDQVRKIALHDVQVVGAQAVILARLGKHEEARKHTAEALNRSPNAAVSYQAASAYAVLARTNGDDRDLALRYLRQTVRLGFRNVEHMKNDEDMSALKDLPEFQAILQLARDIEK